MEDKALRLPAQLCRMDLRALAGMHIAEEKAETIMVALGAAGLTKEQVTMHVPMHVRGC